MNLENVDLVVIGGGPAGLAAAIKAKGTGVENVVIMERAEQLGGLLHQCIHNGFGLKYFKQDLTGPEYAHRFIEKLKNLGIRFLLKSMVIDISPDKEITVVCAEKGIVHLHPKAIVLAMGCRERTRGAINIPGTRPAGVFTAGVAQRFINVEGFIPGNQIVILGSGDVGMIMARRLTLEGAKVKAVVEILSYVGGLIRNEVQCLHDFDIPLLLEHTISRIHGLNRIEAVTIARVDKNFCPISGTEKTIACDTLLLSVGLIPENELSLKAGVRLDPTRGGPVVNEQMETNIPGIFTGGNVVQVHDLVDDVTLESEVAGCNAAKYVLGEIPISTAQISLRAGKGIRYVVPNSITSENNVTLYMRVVKPDKNVFLRIGDSLLEKKLPVIKPSEMLKVSLSIDKLKMLRDGTREVVISCIREEDNNETKV